MSNVDWLLDNYERFKKEEVVTVATPTPVRPRSSALSRVPSDRSLQIMHVYLEVCRRLFKMNLVFPMTGNCHACTHVCEFVCDLTKEIHVCMNSGHIHVCTAGECEVKHYDGSGEWICTWTSNRWPYEFCGIDPADDNGDDDGDLRQELHQSNEIIAYGDTAQHDDDIVYEYGARYDQDRIYTGTGRKRKHCGSGEGYIPENKRRATERLAHEAKEKARLTELASTGKVDELLADIKEQKAARFIRSRDQSLRLSGYCDTQTVNRNDPRSARLEQIRDSRRLEATRLESQAAALKTGSAAALVVTATTPEGDDDNIDDEPLRKRTKRKPPPKKKKKRKGGVAHVHIRPLRIRMDSPEKQLSIAGGSIRKILQLRGAGWCCDNEEHLDQLSEYCRVTWNLIAGTYEFQQNSNSSGGNGQKAWYSLEHHCIVILRQIWLNPVAYAPFIPTVRCITKHYDEKHVNRVYFGVIHKRLKRVPVGNSHCTTKLRKLSDHFRLCMRNIPLTTHLPDVYCPCKQCSV